MFKYIFPPLFFLSTLATYASYDSGVVHRQKAFPASAVEPLLPDDDDNGKNRDRRYPPDTVIQISSPEEPILSEKDVRLKELYDSKAITVPPLDPEMMHGFPGNPYFLKLPRDYWSDFLLKRLDLETLKVLRQTCKAIYLDLLTNRYTAGYFCNLYRERSFHYVFEHTLGQTTVHIKGLYWFLTTHRSQVDEVSKNNLSRLLQSLDDYSWCLTVVFDPAYRKTKKKMLEEVCADTPTNLHSDMRSSWVYYSTKLKLALCGGDNYGTWALCTFKLLLNAGLIYANTYFSANEPAFPSTCKHVFVFDSFAFRLNSPQFNEAFFWTTAYREIMCKLPSMALLVFNLRIAAIETNRKLSEKQWVINLRNRILENHQQRPSSRNNTNTLNKYVDLACYTSIYVFFTHVVVLLQYITPRLTHIRIPSISFANYTQILTDHSINATWIQDCCLSTLQTFTKGCYVPEIPYNRLISVFEFQADPYEFLKYVTHFSPLYLAFISVVLYLL